MKNMKPERRTKEELVRSNKVRKMIIIILAGMLAYYIISNIWNSASDTINPEINGSITSNESSSESNGELVDYIKGFMYGILALEYPWLTKLLIFLGIIYLFQVALSITGDIVQLVLIIGVAIIRFIRWIYRKMMRIDDDDD